MFFLRIANIQKSVSRFPKKNLSAKSLQGDAEFKIASPDYSIDQVLINSKPQIDSPNLWLILACFGR